MYWLKIGIEMDDETGFLKASQKSKVQKSNVKSASGAGVGADASIVFGVNVP